MSGPAPSPPPAGESQTLELVTEAPVPSSKVEITVAGHTVALEGAESCEQLANLALRLYRETTDYARLVPLGFSPPPADLQIAGSPPAQPGWDGDDD